MAALPVLPVTSEAVRSRSYANGAGPLCAQRNGRPGCVTVMLRRVLLALLVVAAALQTRSAAAISDPTLEWWTIETQHYRVHYERNLEPIALRVARIAEHTRAQLSGLLGYAPDEYTEIVITDDTDLANGSATAVPYNTIRLFVTAPADISPLADYDDWYLDLFTHEQTHILHTDNISGIPAVVNAIIGKTLVPNQAQPRWVLEGLSIIAETTYSSAGRLRASVWDMYLRADVLEDNLARLDQFSNPARRWPQGTLWYLYGSYFTSWIAEVYGRDTWRAVSADYGASLVPFGINRAIRRVTGRTYEELYEGFKLYLQRRYHAQMHEVVRRGMREGTRLTFHGRRVAYPRFVPHAALASRAPYEIIYYRDDLHHRPGHYRFTLPRGLEAQPVQEELVARASRESPIGFTPEGGLVFASTVPYKTIYQRSDLFLLPAGQDAPGGDEPHRQRLTVGLRALAPTVSASGRLMAFTVNHRGTTSLQLAPLSADGHLGRRRTLAKSARFDQVYTPAFSPDGQTIAFSRWSTGGFRDIWLVDVASGQVRRITHDRAMDLQPCWSADGRKLYFSSDRTGIYNIYEYTLADGRLRQVTNVRTGAFMPTVSEDGRLLVYAGYTSAGFDLYVMTLDPARYLPAPDPQHVHPHAPAQAPPTPFKRYRYRPLPTFRPHRWFFEYAPGNFGSNALTITVDGADVVGHHLFAARVVADPEAPAPQASLDYTYARLPFDLSLRLANRVSPRTDYTFNDQQPEFIEAGYSFRSGISYADLQEFWSQRIGLSHTVSIIDSSLPVASLGPFDPYAAIGKEPFRGVMSTIHLGYSLSTAESSFDTAGTPRGLNLNLGLDVADEALGSEQSLYAGSFRARLYVPMPWPGRHTLALSSAGAMSGGTYSRRGIYHVGGYNVEEVALLDLLTTPLSDGGFTMRGYPPNAYSGSKYLLENVEYRFPIATVDAGPSTIPVYLRRLDGNLFLDFGGAFNALDFEQIKLLTEGSLIHSPQLHTAVGAELWAGLSLAYAVNLHLRLGYAYGFSGEALPTGQLYFIATNAF